MNLEETLNLKLMEQVEKHPCLFNHKLTAYSNKIEMEKAWEEVAKEMEIEAKKCKERWTNLRTTFVRKLKPAPSESKAKKRYYLEDSMQFLIPYIKGHNTEEPSGNSDINIEKETSNQSEEEARNADGIFMEEVVDNIQPRTFGCSSASPPISWRRCKSKSKSSDSVGTENIIAEYFLNRNKKITENKEDFTKSFLNSLVPNLRQMSTEQLKWFKRKVLEFIDDILGENIDMGSSSSVSFANSNSILYILSNNEEH